MHRAAHAEGSIQVTGIKPVLQALLVADHVYRDAITGKYLVCGVFGVMYRREASPAGEEIELGGNSLLQPGFDSGSPFAFLSLIDVEGEQNFALRYVRLKDDRVLLDFKLKVTSKDRLSPAQLSVPLPKLPLEYGAYALELIWNDVEPLGAYRISVLPLGGEKS